MNKIEVNDVLDFLSMNYQDFKVTDELFNMWTNELQQYDKEDVMEKIKDMMKTGYYNNRPPILLNITSGLTKKDKKIDWKKVVTFCPRCNKAFQCDKTGYSKEYEDHRGKCMSINYVIKQTKKWFNKELSRAELWAMPEKEFNERYDKLLHYIYDHTEDETEKKYIGFVFNPPNQEQTKSMLKDAGVEVDE